MKKEFKIKAGGTERKAFIFTTDAFLALPLIVLAVSTFVAFSITLRDNITMQDYAYRIANDAMNVLTDASPSMVGAGDTESFAYIITENIQSGRISDANQTAIILDSIIPSNADYILEYKSGLGSWTTIREVNRNNKFSRYSIQVSSTKLVVAANSPRLTPFTNCANDLVCSSNPGLQYTPSSLVGPILLRIRLFI